MADVGLEFDGGVAVITLENEERRNALTPTLAGLIAAACDEVDSRPELGAVVIRGARVTFCSGADTALFSPSVDWLTEGVELLDAIYAGFARVRRLTVPSVAAVRGAAVGAGMNLLTSTDLRIVAEDARMLGGFLDIGLHPGGGFISLIGALAGPQTAAALSLFGEGCSGSDAARLGLAWAAVPDDQVEPRALEIAARAARDPELTRRVTRSLRQELGPPALSWEAALDLERGSQVWSLHRRAMRSHPG
jgi:enoyl-CoA hydratase